MEFSYSSRDGVGIMSLKGNLIGEHDGMPLANEFDERMEEGIVNFVADLSELQHINSSGLGVLITLLTKTRKKDGELVLVNPSDFIRNLMLITKLNTIFKVFGSVEEAVGHYSGI